MVFSSILFLFKFLPAALVIYYLAPPRFKNGILLVLSLIFYAWGEPKYILIMFASIFLDYTVGLCIERFRGNRAVMRIFLCCSILFNLGMLGFFKYANFFLENSNTLLGTAFSPLAVTLPLGISFYTFQTMSYSIDVYRGNVTAERNLINFGAFVCLFPQLIAGPIVKYTDINKALKSRKLSLIQVQDGIFLFIMGLGCKVLLANNVGMLWEDVGQIGFQNISTPLAWLGISAYALQIYFDFSGYSLMAIGLGKMLGFHFPKNFNFPYISKSMTEFWRRWHMTLSGWFRDYLYIPLGGNRKGISRTFFNLFLVWIATGFWHGASWNFVLWGLYFFMLLILEKTFLSEQLEKSWFLSRLYFMVGILISWVLFAITDFSQIGLYLSRMFSLHLENDWLYYLKNYGVTLLAGIFFSTPLCKRLTWNSHWESWIKPATAMAVLILSTAYLVDATYNPFLYFRF